MLNSTLVHNSEIRALQVEAHIPATVVINPMLTAPMAESHIEPHMDRMAVHVQTV